MARHDPRRSPEPCGGGPASANPSESHPGLLGEKEGWGWITHGCLDFCAPPWGPSRAGSIRSHCTSRFGENGTPAPK